jgi:hypothetical protein
MKFEIEIVSNEASTEIFELKDFLLHNDMQSFKIQLKEYAPIEGEMSLALTAAAIVGEKVIDIALEKCFGIVLEDKIKAWLEKRNTTKDSQIDIVTSIISEKEKIHYVTDSNGGTKSIDQDFTLIAQNTTAVIIGNGEFESNFSRIEPINGNVEQIYKILSDKRIFNIPRENIKILLNKTNIEIEEELLNESKKNNLETFVIYFAGHGYRANLNKLYLISKNSRKIGDHIIGAIDFDFIKDVVLNGSTANNKIILLDACHSGVATQSENGDKLVETMNVKGSYILASSSADQVSYFNSDHTTTYFTNEFVNVFKRGLPNDNEWLSIDDIFENLKNNLAEKKLPLPRSKSELSIPTSNFLLANNIQFDAKVIFEKAKRLFRNGSLEEALQILNRLHLKNPHNSEVKSELEKCRNELLFNRYIEDGDKYYFVNKDYIAALKAYTNAQLVKDEYSVISKIEKCKNLISQSPKEGNLITEAPTKKDTQKIPTQPNLKIKEQQVKLPPKQDSISSNSNIEYPKKITQQQIILTYLAGTIGLIIPIAQWGLSLYSMITGFRWWKLKIIKNGREINKYDEITQKHGRIIFIIGSFVWTIVILFFLGIMIFAS